MKKQNPFYIEKKLTPKEIEEYRKRGYIVEDISVTPLNKFTYQDGGEPKVQDLEEVTVYRDMGKRKMQGNLFDKLDQVKNAYNNYRTQLGLDKQRQSTEGRSSIGSLKEQIASYKVELEKEKKIFDRATKALNVLQKKDPDNWKNAKVKDVLSAKGVDALRSLYKDNKISDATFRDFYDTYGKNYDRNTTVTSADDQAALEKSWYGPENTDGRTSLLEYLNDPRNVVDVAKVAAKVAPLAPFAPAVLANPLVQAGLTGYGIYDATTNALPQAYKDFKRKDYKSMAQNLGWAALDLAPIPIVGTNVVDDVVDAGKYLQKGYKQVATGNSRLTDFGFPAWRVERPTDSLIGDTENSRRYIARRNTDREAELLDKFGKGMGLTPEEWKEMEVLVNSGATDFTNINTPISRIPLYYNYGEEAIKEADELLNLKVGQTFTTPSEKSIRTWSAGIPEGYDAERLARSKPNQKIRLVIPSRYTKNLGNSFAAMPYDDKRIDFIWPDSKGTGNTTFNEFASKENELMGNIPKGFKLIGKSKEDGMTNLIIKPLQEKQKGYKQINTPKQLPGSGNATKQFGLSIDNLNTKGIVNKNIKEEIAHPFGKKGRAYLRTGQVDYDNGLKLKTYLDPKTKDLNLISVENPKTGETIFYEKKGFWNENFEQKYLNEWSIKADMPTTDRKLVKFANQELEKVVPVKPIKYEGKTISTDGLRYWNQQQKHGYSAIDDFNKPYVSAAGKDDLFKGLKYSNNDDAFESVRFANKKDATEGAARLENFIKNQGLDYKVIINNDNTLQINLPKLQRAFSMGGMIAPPTAIGAGAAATSNEYKQGGYIEAELTDKEIKDLEGRGYKIQVMSNFKKLKTKE